jgi:hypothetical protein
MKVLALICVGVDDDGLSYASQCIDNVKRLVNEFNFDVRILTDTPQEFEGVGCTTYQYEKKIFSYFDKFFFSFKLIKELKTDVTYVDCDSLNVFLSDEKYRTLESFDEVLYLTFWPVNVNGEWKSWKYLPDINVDKWARPIIEFLTLEGTEPSKLETMFEQLFYFPVGLDYDKIQYELEKIKPVFEYASLYDKNLYRRTIYGHGEGAALSYALYVLNIKRRAIEKPVTFEESYNFISRTKLVKN